VIRDETSELSFTLVSSPQDAFVAEARHHLHAFLAREDVDDELVAPAEVVLSELVASAATRGAPDIDVGVQIDGDAIRIAVTHGAPDGEPTTVGLGGGGWGLRVVDELATRWDEGPRLDGKPGATVRAEILLV
jgi:hypothetical protein